MNVTIKSKRLFPRGNLYIRATDNLENLIDPSVDKSSLNNTIVIFFIIKSEEFYKKLNLTSDFQKNRT